MNDNQDNQEIESLGEFGLIDLLTKDAELRNESSQTGVGDDAAVISANENMLNLLSADMLGFICYLSLF